MLNEDEDWTEKTVCWWHMGDGAVLGVHDGMVIEYDPTTLAPLGMVISKDELMGRKVAVIDAGLEPCNIAEDAAECAQGREGNLPPHPAALRRPRTLRTSSVGSAPYGLVRLPTSSTVRL